MTWSFGLAIWGSVLATILGIIEVVKHFRDRPRIRIQAELNLLHTTPDAPSKGRKVQTPTGLQEARVLVRVANAGQKPIQVTACFADYGDDGTGSRVEILAESLPAIVNPYTGAQLFLQTEWFETGELTSFGVVDALGEAHPLGPKQFEDLARRCQGLPGAPARLLAEGPNGTALAFVATDPGVIRKLKGDA